MSKLPQICVMCVKAITIGGTSTLLILGIYHPPDTNNYRFIDDITNKIISELSQHENLVIEGDLNIHWDDTHSHETSLLRDATEALGLKQHVHEYIHNANHIISVLMTQSIGLIKVIKCKTGEFISDHRLVYMDISIKKPRKQGQNN